MGLRQRKEEQTRARIMDVSFQIFCNHGIGEATMADIAEQSDVSRTTLYNYFPSKQILLEAVYIQNLQNSVMKINESITKINFYEFIQQMMDYYAKILIENPEVLVFDAQFNIYAALMHQDPTKYPDHVMNSLNMNEYKNITIDKLIEEEMNFYGDPFEFLYNISQTYYEHIQKMAIFRMQRQKNDLEQVKRDLEAYNQIYIHLLFPNKKNAN